MKRTKLKRLILVLILILAVCWGYVEIVNLHSRDMTVRQKLLKAIYPVFTWLSRSGDRNKDELATKAVKPLVSFYSLKAVQNDGKEFNLNSLKGKKIMVVNTASDCGYTAQYAELQSLFEQHRDKLVILGFPANDFKEQEKGTDEEIAQFCKLNYGVQFPLAKKSSVIKSDQQNEVFKWLTDKTKNGWNEQQPTWNFSKYLIDENGALIKYFDPAVSPASDEVIKAIE